MRHPSRRRLLLYSAPVGIVLVVMLVKLWSVVIAGGAVGPDFAKRDVDALRGDVDALGVVNVVEPAKAFFAAGALAVLDDHLADAGKQFSLALAHTDPSESCPVRINLELVGETLGDRAVAAADPDGAIARYRDALTVVTAAPPRCFAGSTDPDAGRRAVLDSAAARLQGKLDVLSQPLPPLPPPPPGAPPPAPSPSTVNPATAPETVLRLDPGDGDPLDRLQQILRDAAAAAPDHG